MSGWKRICCGVDATEESCSALLEAAGLARRLDAELTLVHVHDPRPPPSGDALAAAAELERVEEAAAELHRQVEVWKSAAASVVGHPVRSAVFGGSPAADLVRFADAHDMDAIVVGTHGRRGVSRLVRGSVAERVVRDARCPVVVVHHDQPA